MLLNYFKENGFRAIPNVSKNHDHSKWIEKATGSKWKMAGTQS